MTVIPQPSVLPCCLHLAVIDSRVTQTSVIRSVTVTILVALAALALVPGRAFASGTRAAAARAGLKAVSYRGVRLTVPSAWPVLRLGAGSSVCVRFNRHAVYLGRPGNQQSCPMQAAGRTEAILVAPRAGGAAGISGGDAASWVDAAHGVEITATWNRDPAVIRRALGVRSLPAATDLGAPPVARSSGGRRARAAGAAIAAAPGQVYTGLGFDACAAPSSSAMATWTASSPFRAVGIYIGGADAACAQPNLTAAWVSVESAAGWHLIPTYVGLQAPGNGCGCAAMSSTPVTAATQGTAAAQDAVAHAQALGIGAGNPIYYDMENYTRGSASAAVLAFEQAWTDQLHADGYRSGIYGNASTGITDLVSEVGKPFAEPDDIWIADWNGSESTSDTYVPATYWAEHQRLHQYRGGHTDDYGGVKISIDTDYLDGSTAAYGSGTLVSTSIAQAPTLTIRPQPGGAVNLTPSWPGEAGVTSYQFFGGGSPAALTPIETVSAAAKFPLKLKDNYSYFQVEGLNAAGQILGSSGPVATPSSVAIFGNSGFISSSGAFGIPVACPHAGSCDVQAAVYEGRKRLAQSVSEELPIAGGLARVPLARSVYTAAEHAPGRRLPVSVSVTSSSGAKVTRSLNLVPFTTGGRAPARRIWHGHGVRILAATSFVSNGWVGGVLVACTAGSPCVTTASVTRSGLAIAKPRTQTLGAGEIGYLPFTLNASAHARLRASAGNQYGARVTVTAAPAPGAVGLTARAETATALVSLVGFR